MWQPRTWAVRAKCKHGFSLDLRTPDRAARVGGDRVRARRGGAPLHRPRGTPPRGQAGG